MGDGDFKIVKNDNIYTLTKTKDGKTSTITMTDTDSDGLDNNDSVSFSGSASIFSSDELNKAFSEQKYVDTDMKSKTLPDIEKANDKINPEENKKYRLGSLAESIKSSSTNTTATTPASSTMNIFGNQNSSGFNTGALAELTNKWAAAASMATLCSGDDPSILSRVMQNMYQELGEFFKTNNTAATNPASTGSVNVYPTVVDPATGSTVNVTAPSVPQTPSTPATGKSGQQSQQTQQAEQPQQAQRPAGASYNPQNGYLSIGNGTNLNDVISVIAKACGISVEQAQSIVGKISEGAGCLQPVDYYIKDDVQNVKAQASQQVQATATNEKDSREIAQALYNGLNGLSTDGSAIKATMQKVTKDNVNMVLDKWDDYYKNSKSGNGLVKAINKNYYLTCSEKETLGPIQQALIDKANDLGLKDEATSFEAKVNKEFGKLGTSDSNIEDEFESIRQKIADKQKQG